MGYLKDTRCYLSGPIQYHDTNWRQKPVEILNQFNVNFFDPFSDPKQQWVAMIKEAMNEGDFEAVVSIAKKFVRKDLCMVDRSDFVVAYLPHEVPTTGTHHEIFVSNMAKKPTLLVTNSDDISNIPLWYFGFIPIEFMFPNWLALHKYLETVDKGEQKHNDKWSFIYGDI